MVYLNFAKICFFATKIKFQKTTDSSHNLTYQVAAQRAANPTVPLVYLNFAKLCFFAKSIKFQKTQDNSRNLTHQEAAQRAANPPVLLVGSN